MRKWRSPAWETRPTRAVALTLGTVEPEVKYPRIRNAPIGGPIGAFLQNDGETT